jgi:hypothetical protein
MTHGLETLETLRRPRLLVRAARFGLSEYVRERDLKRVFGTIAPPGPGKAVSSLIEREDEIEAVRQAGTAGYSAARHVEVLTALMAEGRLAAEAIS